MGKFFAALRTIFGSIFGRRDYVHLLTDDFEVDPAMTAASPAELLQAARERQRPQSQGPRRRHRQPPPPKQLQASVAQGMARDTYGSRTSLEIPDAEDFDWSADFSIASDSLASEIVAPAAPVPVTSAAATMLKTPNTSHRGTPGDGVVRLVHRVTPQPTEVQASGAIPPVMVPTQVSTTTPPGSLAGGAPPQTPLLLHKPVRRVAVYGPPPSTLWDENEIKMELLEQLDEERARPPAGVPREDWRIVLDRLARALGDLKAKLPTLPSAAGKLIGQDGTPPSDEEVVAAIKGDPALAARLVKVANSPFYMAARPASSLQSALVRIGLNDARRLAIAAAFEDTFELASDPGLLAELRQHALATAVAGEFFARSAREVDSGEAFLAGLLCDAGELLVHRIVQGEENKSRPVDPVAARELSLRTHQRVGALLFGEWDLDAGVAATLGWHHTPHLVEERFSAIVHVIHAADRVADLATEHSRSSAWASARSLYSEWDNPSARAAAMEADGINNLDLNELLTVVPPNFGAERLKGVIRGVMLRLETSPA